MINQRHQWFSLVLNKKRNFFKSYCYCWCFTCKTDERETLEAKFWDCHSPGCVYAISTSPHDVAHLCLRRVQSIFGMLCFTVLLAQYIPHHRSDLGNLALLDKVYWHCDSRVRTHEWEDVDVSCKSYWSSGPEEWGFPLVGRDILLVTDQQTTSGRFEPWCGSWVLSWLSCVLFCLTQWSRKLDWQWQWQ